MHANDQNLLDDVDDARDLERFAARADGFTNKSGTWKLGHNGHNEECNGNGRRSSSIVACVCHLLFARFSCPLRHMAPKNGRTWDRTHFQVDALKAKSGQDEKI